MRHFRFGVPRQNAKVSQSNRAMIDYMKFTKLLPSPAELSEPQVTP